MNCQILRYFFVFISVIILLACRDMNIIKERKWKNKFFQFLVYFVILIIITTISYFIPIQFKCNTLEEAFNRSFINTKILKVIEKENYGFIVYTYLGDKNSTSLAGFIKKDGKWLTYNSLINKHKFYHYDSYLIDVSINSISTINVHNIRLDINIMSEKYKDPVVIDSNGNKFDCYATEYKYRCENIVTNIDSNYYIKINDEILTDF